MRQFGTGFSAKVIIHLSLYLWIHFGINPSSIIEWIRLYDDSDMESVENLRIGFIPKKFRLRTKMTNDIRGMRYSVKINCGKIKRFTSISVFVKENKIKIRRVNVEITRVHLY